MNAYELAQLIAPGKRPRSGGQGRFQVPCPAHDDKNPSLTVWVDEKGKAAFNCHAGCSHEAITEKLPQDASEAVWGTWKAPATVIRLPARPAPDGTIRYAYRHPDGSLAYHIVRTVDKQFRLEPRGAQPILYNLPEIVQALGNGDPIYVVEGEKDADTLTALGVVATTSPFGAGKFDKVDSTILQGAPALYVIPDNDEPGRKHAQRVADITGAKILELPGLPDKGDVSDWLAMGHAVQELGRLAGESSVVVNDWQPVDLWAVLEGGTDLDPPPSVLRRSDGKALLYAGELNWLNGEPEAGKSFMAQYAALQEIQEGREVLYIDLEDTPSRVVDRLRLMGASGQQIGSYLRYIRPSQASSETDVEAIVAMARSCSLCVIDGTTDLHVIHGLEIEDNMDSARMISHLLRPIANAGAAVLPLDHVTKAKDTRGRYSIGAQHKLAAVRGAAYGLECIDPMGRGVVGQSRMWIFKDRPGHVRGTMTLRVASKHSAGDFYVDATSKVRIEARIDPPDVARRSYEHQRVEAVYEAVVAWHTDNGNAPTQRKVQDLVPHNKDDVVKALDLLVEARRLVVQAGPKRSYLYYPAGTLNDGMETENAQ